MGPKTVLSVVLRDYFVVHQDPDCAYCGEDECVAGFTLPSPLPIDSNQTSGFKLQLSTIFLGKLLN